MRHGCKKKGRKERRREGKIDRAEATVKEKWTAEGEVGMVLNVVVGGGGGCVCTTRTRRGRGTDDFYEIYRRLSPSLCLSPMIMMIMTGRSTHERTYQRTDGSILVTAYPMHIHPDASTLFRRRGRVGMVLVSNLKIRR